MAHIVFDIGGSTVRVGRAEGDMLGEVRRVQTPEEPQKAVEALTAHAKELSAGEPTTHCAGGVAGTFAKEGVIYHSPNLPQWDGFDIGGALSAALGVEAVVQNDADLAALGEAQFGAGKGFDIVAFLTGGTGVGGSRVVHGRTDASASGFEPGQYLCDANTTFEALVSGRAIEERYGMLATRAPHEMWEELTPALARGLYTTMLFWSPHVIVLSGGVFLYEQGFQLDRLKRELGALNTMFPALPELRRGALGDNAVLWGAITLLKN